MKKLLFAVLTLLSLSAVAQEDKEIIIEKRIDAEKPSTKKTQEIIIRSKGDKDKKITVEINGDKVTINGKPLVEFKDDDITINKRNIRIFDGKKNLMFEPNDMEVYFDGPMKGILNSNSSSAFLGVTTAVINEDKNDIKPNGAVITTINSGSAAEKAGLKENDIITKIDDKKIATPTDLTEAIAAKKVKDVVTVTYSRDGKVSTTKATLGDRKNNAVTAYTFTSPNGSRSFSLPRLPNMNSDNFLRENKTFGDFNLDDINPENIDRITVVKGRPKIGLKIQDVEEGSGVKVLATEEESPAEKAGLKKDDIITEINGKAVNNTDDARELLKPEENKNNYTIKAKRNGAVMSFDIKIPKKLKTANL